MTMATAAPVPPGMAKPGGKAAPATALGLAGFLLALEVAGLVTPENTSAKPAPAVTLPAMQKLPAAQEHTGDRKDEQQAAADKSDDAVLQEAAATIAAQPAPAPAVIDAIIPQPVVMIPAPPVPGGNTGIAATQNRPQAEMPVAQSPQPAPPPAKEELAFAARIISAQEAPAQIEKAHEPSPTLDHASPSVASTTPANRTPATRPLGPVAAKPPVIETAPEVKPAAVRELSVRVAGEREHIEVRMVEQNGEMRVAVRTPDVDLARGLRSGISDLVGRLEHSGYQAEVWRPSESAQADNHHPHSGARDGQPDRQSGSSQKDQQQRDQRQQPTWVEEMSATLGRGIGQRS